MASPQDFHKGMDGIPRTTTKSYIMESFIKGLGGITHRVYRYLLRKSMAFPWRFLKDTNGIPIATLMDMIGTPMGTLEGN